MEKRKFAALALAFIIVLSLSATFQAAPASAALLPWDSFQPGFLDTDVTNNTVMGMVVFKGSLYVGTTITSAEVWRSTDGENWTQSAAALGDRIWFLIACGDYLYVSVHHASGSTVYKTADGLSWTVALTSMDQIWRGAVFDGRLVVDVADKLYTTEDGVVWSYMSRINNLEGLYEFGDYFYVTFPNTSNYVEIWRSRDLVQWEVVTTNLFGYTDSTHAMTFAVFENQLYLGTWGDSFGFEVFRTADGLHWARVASNGFGNGNNAFSVQAMAVLGSQLYLGVRCRVSSGLGAQVWRTDDGLNWEQVNTGGFGNTLRYGVENWTMAAFENRLYLGTGNQGSLPDTKTMGGAMVHRTVNRAPVAQDAAATIRAGGTVEFILTATDDDGDALTYQIAEQPAHGSVSLNGNAATYTPDSGYSGPDRFTWKASDGQMLSAADEVFINGSGSGGGSGGGGGGCFISVVQP